MKNCTVNSLSRLESRAFIDSRLTVRFLELFKGWPVSIAHEIIHKNGRGISWGMHKKTQEFVYVIKGNARAYLGNRRVTVGAGDYLLIPPGVRHRFVTGERPLIALSVFSPPMTFDNLDAVACAASGKRRG